MKVWNNEVSSLRDAHTGAALKGSRRTHTFTFTGVPQICGKGTDTLNKCIAGALYGAFQGFIFCFRIPMLFIVNSLLHFQFKKVKNIS